MGTVYESLIDYYANLLIIQYHNKTNAKATIELLTRTLIPENSETGNPLIDDIAYGFNIDTAVGAQLDILGKYIGLERFYSEVDYIEGNYFAFTDYDETIIADDKRGFTDYTDFDTAEGDILTYDEVSLITNLITDIDYRFLLKLKIIQNNINHSHKEIDDNIFDFFGTDLVADTDFDMKMVYFFNSSILDIVTLATIKDVLPRPIGVGYDLIESVDGGYFSFATYETTTFDDDEKNGFTTYDDFETKIGECLIYNTIITP